ncbi:13506_t:CDS:2, partial [Racocetra persica]
RVHLQVFKTFFTSFKSSERVMDFFQNANLQQTSNNPLRETSNKATPVLELLKGEMTMDDYLNGNQKTIRKLTLITIPKEFEFTEKRGIIRRELAEREQDENFEPVINNTKDEVKLKPKDSNRKPLYTYASLIGQAILQAPNRRLPLNEIYEWIMATYPFYKKENKGWQNSIRHNLTLCPAFRKVERESGHPAKGSYWTIPDEFMCCFVNGAYKNERMPTNNKKKKKSKTGDKDVSSECSISGAPVSKVKNRNTTTPSKVKVSDEKYEGQQQYANKDSNEYSNIQDTIMNSNQSFDDDSNFRDTFMYSIQPVDVYNHQIIDIFQYAGGLTEMGNQTSDIDDFINDHNFNDTLSASSKTFYGLDHCQTNIDNVNPDPDGLRYFYAMKCNVKQECERYVNMREVEFQDLDAV